MMKFKHVAVIAVLAAGIVSAGHAQAKAGRSTRADSVNFEKANEFRICATKSPPKTFAVVKNVLWYATEEIVIEHPNPWASKTHKPHSKLGDIGSANATAIAADSRGNIWVACEAGVASYAGGKWTSYTEESGLPSSNALALAAAPNGDVWVGTDKGAARFSNGSWTTFGKGEGKLPAEKVQAIAVDSRGNVYLGTHRGGLSVYDGAAFKTYNAKNTGDNGPEWNDILVLAVAKEPNREVIWMADGPAGNINSFDGKKWSRWVEIQKGITSIMYDSRRTWFGHDGGVLRFNGEEWISDPNMHGIPAEQVFSMLRDNDGNLWFGMEKGVMMLNNPYKR